MGCQTFLGNICWSKLNVFSNAFLRSIRNARRIPDFPDSYSTWNFISSYGSIITTFGMVYFFIAIICKTENYLITVKYLTHFLNYVDDKCAKLPGIIVPYKVHVFSRFLQIKIKKKINTAPFMLAHFLNYVDDKCAKLPGVIVPYEVHVFSRFLQIKIRVKYSNLKYYMKLYFRLLKIKIFSLKKNYFKLK